ncbi:VWA domain-containing protein [Myxococcota bacterium]|nr:VWA domain-containing protein [Myxococcota bacterium]
MFLDLLYALRRQRVPVGPIEWDALCEALRQGVIQDLDSLYTVGRAVLVKTEGHYDAWDLAFAEVFHDAAPPPEIKEAIRKWLEEPVPGGISEDQVAQMTGMSLEEVKKRFQEMLERQTERHDGGSRFIGTGGTSPFGTGGRNPMGIQVAGGGGRTAMALAEGRQFRNYRTDVAIDVRQFRVALRRLRRLAREGDLELDLDGTVRRTADNAGDIDLDFRPSRRNRVRLLLLMDAGGSMAPHAELVSRLFTAAHQSDHWKEFRYYFFHNCVYRKVYTDIETYRGVPTEDVLRELSPEWKVVFVGDACMAPWELAAGGGYEGDGRVHVTGIDWLRRFRTHFRRTVWLNPDDPRFWNHTTVAAIRAVHPMFPLTLDGLTQALRHLVRPV